jgi:uncharacterized protein YecE (DUF72 family)
LEFGKTSDLSAVDFSLPDDPPVNSRILGGAGAEGPVEFCLGATGWSIREWVGLLYPKGTKPAQYLHHYSRQFNTIEFNTTYYRLPDAGLVQRWYEQSAADFRFCPKVMQSISHSRDFALGSDLVDRFCEAMKGFREKLGWCFLQLPPYFGPSENNLQSLEQLLARISVPLCVELRHEGWFEDGSAGSELFGLLEKYGVGTVITDVAGRRDVCHMTLTAPVAMVRFVGNDLHPTDTQRLQQWAERLHQWCEQGLREVYFFMHQPDEQNVPLACRQLMDLVEQWNLPLKTRCPQILQGGQQGEQLSLF